MRKDSKPNKDRILRYLVSNIIKTQEDEDQRRDERMSLSNARDLIGAIASWAGKGKDEVVQVLCREIGMAVAAVFKEPITQILENRKLQITLELVPVKGDSKPKAQTSAKKAPVRKRKIKSRPG